MRRTVYAFLAVAGLLLAAGYPPNIGSIPPAGPAIHSALTTIPGTTTAVTAKNSWIDMVTISNPTAGALTFTLTDSSTNCSSGVCTLIGAVSVAANQTFVISFPGGIPMAGGVKWAGSSTGLIGYIRGVKLQ